MKKRSAAPKRTRRELRRLLASKDNYWLAGKLAALTPDGELQEIFGEFEDMDPEVLDDPDTLRDIYHENLEMESRRELLDRILDRVRDDQVAALIREASAEA